MASEPSMFSSLGPFSLSSRKNGTTTPRIPKGFAIRPFKGPTLPTHHLDAAVKLDPGYRPTSSPDSWQGPHPSARPRGLAPNPTSFPTFAPRPDIVGRALPMGKRRPSSYLRNPSPASDSLIFERCVSESYTGHFDCDPYPHHAYQNTPYALARPLTDSSESLIEEVLPSPPLSVRALIPPAIPQASDTHHHNHMGDPIPGYPPAAFDHVPRTPFMGWSSLPPSSRSDSDDDTLVEPDDRSPGKADMLIRPDSSPFFPDGTPHGVHPAIVGTHDYDGRRAPLPPLHPEMGAFRHVAYGPDGQHAPPARRYTDPGPAQPVGEAIAAASSRPRRASTSTPRCVRWNENLICPSPILPSQRRKGWFNRRGDQLWTNDGAYKPAEPGNEYPLDLNDYPDVGHGWMNERGVRIDMGHHLIPKVPLRSALKKSKSPTQTV